MAVLYRRQWAAAGLALWAVLSGLTGCGRPWSSVRGTPDEAGKVEVLSGQQGHRRSRPLSGAPELWVRLDPAAWELPEGLAVSGDQIVIGLAPTSEVLIVDEKAQRRVFGQLPKVAPGAGFMTGLAFDSGGGLYVGLVSFAEEGPTTGIYRIEPHGGLGTLFAAHPALTFPNGLVVRGESLYVTDSALGAVFRIDLRSAVTRIWVKSKLLRGDGQACPPAELPFDLGANGIALGPEGSVYVVNSDLATLVKVPRLAGGAAGRPEVVVGPACAQLEGADGLLVTPTGDWLVTANRLNKLLRVSASGQITVLHSGAPLDFPSNIAVRDDGTLVIANFALMSAQNVALRAFPGVVALPCEGCSVPK